VYGFALGDNLADDPLLSGASVDATVPRVESPHHVHPAHSSHVGRRGSRCVAAGWAHTLLVDGGRVFALGSNEQGQLGLAPATVTPPPLSDLVHAAAADLRVEELYRIRSGGGSGTVDTHPVAMEVQ
jgi:hypothetical protein